MSGELLTHGEYVGGSDLVSLIDPEVRASIPDLSIALDAWLKTGDLRLMHSRSRLMSGGHLATVFALNAYRFMAESLLPNGQKRPFMIVNHEPGFSAGENAKILEKQAGTICQTLGINQLPQILKTVTLEYRDKGTRNIVLVSGIGDFKLDNGIKREIGRELKLSRAVFKNAVINPEFDTESFLGLQPGIVKPILEPNLVGNIQGICYLRGRAKPRDFVVVSVSHIDSMIMRVEDFEYLFRDYAKDKYINFGLVSKLGYDFYTNNNRAT